MGLVLLVLCGARYWVWRVPMLFRAFIASLDAPEGACFGLASWPGADLHHSGDVGLRLAEKSGPSSLQRTEKVKSFCFSAHASCLRHLRFESIGS